MVSTQMRRGDAMDRRVADIKVIKELRALSEWSVRTGQHAEPGAELTEVVPV